VASVTHVKGDPSGLDASNEADRIDRRVCRNDLGEPGLEQRFRGSIGVLGWHSTLAAHQVTPLEHIRQVQTLSTDDLDMAELFTNPDLRAKIDYWPRLADREVALINPVTKHRGREQKGRAPRLAIWKQDNRATSCPQRRANQPGVASINEVRRLRRVANVF
jgi:hypothetical protein